jgi:hypothetical protein
MFAGRDMENVQVNLQNLSVSDSTELIAGRDLRYTGTFRSGNSFSAGGGYIQIGGPGRLLVQAGRDISLGTTAGINAAGNLMNIDLPSSKSADLTVVAGYTGDASFSEYENMFSSLKEAGLKNEQEMGRVAIDRLFGATNTSPGNLTMYFSQIKTQGNSNIDLIAPSGDINAGLPSPVSRPIGVVTYQGGNIRSYLSGDFNVNQSKILTLQGGDILIYTRDGNIDAGRGALDSRTTQPPRRVTDSVTGLSFFQPPADASGSGIRTVSSDPDGPGPLKAPKPGDVYLFAPSGFVDAGEAGVASAGNIIVVATQVLNASNFSSAGTSSGVPPASSGAVSAVIPGSASAASDATKSATDATRQMVADAAKSSQPKDSYRPTFLTVELLGYGDTDSGNEKK